MVALSAALVLAGGIALAQDASGTSQIVASDSYSSSSAGIPEVNFTAAAAPAGGGQYDNRGNRSSGSWHDHLALEFGGGFNAPTGYSSTYIGWGGNVNVGGGYHFNKMLAMLVEYQFIGNKLPEAIVAETGASGGNVRIWSFTLAPVINLIPKGNNNVYVTGGGGFYRKVTNFTDPQPFQYCDYYYGYCGIGYTNQTIGHFSSNQGGWNVGAGFSHRFGGMYNDGRMSVFAEARYLDVLSPGVYGQSANGLNPTTIGPGTQLIPVTFGLRF
jgi:hypothetical protein